MAAGQRGRGRIALLYHSGTGGTELAARLVAETLAARREVSLLSIGEPGAQAAAKEADFLALFHPTYFLRPSTSMMEFINALGPFERPLPAYIVATCELYSENCVRAAALALRKQGVAVVGSKTLRAPGSDVTCVLPASIVPWLYRFERRFPRKILDIASEIETLAESRAPAPAIPRAKWYTPFARALQFLALDRFAGFAGKLRALEDRCTSCGACVSLCPRGAWSMAPGGPPIHERERCELCTRCLHLCPNRAIVMLPALKDNPRLDRGLYAELAEAARRGMAAEAGRRKA